MLVGLGRRIHRNESGSIVAVMLVAIIAASLATTLVARTIQGQRSVEFDSHFTEVIHGAEAGVQEAIAQLYTMPNAAQSGAVPVQASPPGELEGIEYTWTAVYESPNLWVVTSTGSRSDVSRTIVATVQERQQFPLALFSSISSSFGGNNYADSYNVSGGTPDWCTGNGFAGSNGTLDFNGLAPGDCHPHNSRTVDQVHLYDWEDNPAPPDRCLHSGGENCNDFQSGYPAPAQIDERLEFPGVLDMITKKISDCSVVHPVWQTDAPPVLTPPDISDMSTGYIPAGEHCVVNLYFTSQETVVQGPATFYVTGEVGVNGNNRRVNCEPNDCTSWDNAAVPDAENLFIYYSGSAPLTMRVGTRIAAAIQAPNAPCQGQPNNANVRVFGAVICQSTANVGNWRLHYDDRLGRYGTGEFEIVRWAENP